MVSMNEPSAVAEERERWLAGARAVAEVVSDEAAALETAGTLTEPVLAVLRQTELFWMLLPRELGGGQADIVTVLKVIEEVSRADGSVGWSLMANVAGAAAACAYLPDRALAVIFDTAHRPILAGMLAPRGTAVPVDEGFSLSGRYQFGSGIAYADWVGGGAFVRESGHARTLPSGQLDIRAFFVPRSAVTLLGNWDVLGLRATGSFDYEITDRLVGADFGFALPDPPAMRSEPSFQLGLAPLTAGGHGAVALGIGGRALQELATVARVKRRPGQPGMIDQQLFLHDFAEKEASLQAARALFFNSYNAALDVATRGEEVTSLQRHRLRQAVTYGTTVSADVVRWCYTWSGSDGLRNPSPLGRCLRDISAATQHVFVDPNTMVLAAPELLGEWTS